MREILIKNKWLLERLNGFLKDFEEADVSLLPVRHRQENGETREIGISEEYMYKMIEEKQGPPASIMACDLVAWDRDPSDLMPPRWGEITEDISNNFTRELGAQQNALAAYYPPGGYIGWHDNHDVPGYTVLFNWSKTGDSFYRYRDAKTHEIITIKDRPGWSCKTGYYGPEEESTMHCASTNEPRWSIAFYLRSEELRDALLEEIENEY